MNYTVPRSLPRACPLAVTPRCPLILIVEDNEDAASAMKLLLEIDGSEVKIAGSLAEASTFVDQNVTTVITDLSLPDGSGLLIATMFPDSRCIIASGHERDARWPDCKKHGFQAYLEKPLTITTLRAAVYANGVVSTPPTPWSGR